MRRGGWDRLTGAGWARTLAVLWFAQIIAEVAFSFALPFIPLFISQDLGVTDPSQAALWAGMMAGGFALVMAVLGPVWGTVADRFGRRLMILRALFGAAVVATRRATLHQLLGIVMVENGLVLGAIELPGGASLAIELGVALDLTFIAVVAVVFHERIFAEFGSGDTAVLESLRD